MTREKKSERLDGHKLRPVPLKRKWSRDEPEAILDYLHGDIPASEVQACCYYEYGRTSKIFREARSLFPPATDFEKLRGSLNYPEREPRDPAVYGTFHSVLEQINEARLCPLLNDWRGREILICAGYPEKPWRDLSETERNNICIHFAKSRVSPVVTDSFVLKGWGILAAFAKQAESDWANSKERKGCILRGEYPAIVGDENYPVRHVVLTLDYSHGIEVAKKVVGEWLDDKANARLFERYYKRPIDKGNLNSPDRYKEHLKFLAACRLYDELGFKGAAEWTRSSRRNRKDSLRVRPFFREKRRKTPTGKYFGGPLFKDRRQWEAAVEKASSFLAGEIERELG